MVRAMAHDLQFAIPTLAAFALIEVARTWGGHRPPPRALTLVLALLAALDLVGAPVGLRALISAVLLIVAAIHAVPGGRPGAALAANSLLLTASIGVLYHGWQA